jgi:hypothetical protein
MEDGSAAAKERAANQRKAASKLSSNRFFIKADSFEVRFLMDMRLIIFAGTNAANILYRF